MRRPLLAALVAVVGLGACARDDLDTGPRLPVAVIQVGDERYRIELATPELVDHARRLVAGERLASIPVGRVVRNDSGVNEPWSWHVDPATIAFDELTAQSCDGLPSAVEDGSVTSEFYCPRAAEVRSVERTGSDPEPQP